MKDYDAISTAIKSIYDHFELIEKELEVINNKIDGNEKYLLENLSEIYKHLY
ncbi:MAG: hypothetical protein VW418_03475 [Gammaproteobacteria bacterium]